MQLNMRIIVGYMTFLLFPTSRDFPCYGFRCRAKLKRQNMRSTELWYSYFSVILTCFVIKLINKECLFNNHWNHWVISYLVPVLMDTTAWIGSKNSIALHWCHYERDGVSNHLRLAYVFVQVRIKENIKALRHWPLWGESTGVRWIPLTKSQQRRKCFHLMTSSWYFIKNDDNCPRGRFIKSVNCGVSV